MKAPCQLLYVAPDDPWDRWTNSGTSVQITRGLSQYKRLCGALSCYARDTVELHGRVQSRYWGRRIRRKLFKTLGIRQRLPDSGIDETALPWRATLRSLPPESWVMYHYVLPLIDRSLPIRRVLFQDLTVDDAVKAGGFGHANLSTEQINEKRAQVSKANHDADAIVSFANFVADSMHSQYGIPRSKVYAMGAGPIRRWDRPVPADLNRYKKRQILFCGRAWERKGGPVLLQAFRTVRKEFPDATLTVVSSGAPELNEPGVEQIRFASDEKLHELYSTCSLFCMPSICESWGLVYVEAAAHGCPTANWDNWALPDIVDQHVTGVLTPNHNSDGLAEAIIDAIKDPQHLMEMGQNAVKRVRDVLDWPHCIDRLLAATMPEALEGREPVWMRPRS